VAIGATVTHVLKTDPDVFQESWWQNKKFEIRKNDRDFNVGDYLELRETEYSAAEMFHEGKPLKYTGRRLILKVKYMIKRPIYSLYKTWVIMSCEFVKKNNFNVD